MDIISIKKDADTVKRYEQMKRDCANADGEYDLKELYNRLNEFTTRELEAIARHTAVTRL